MKAFVLGPAYPLRGGIADTDESLARAMLRQHIQTEILSYRYQYPAVLFPGSSQYREDGPPAHLPPIRNMLHSLRPDWWWRAARYIRAEAPDFMISRFWMPFFSPCLGSIHWQVRNRCTRLAMVDNLIPHEKRPGDMPLIRYFTQHCDAFLTMSSAVSDDIRRFSSKPVCTLNHPINEGLGEKLDSREARRKLGLPAEGVVLLFFGLIRAYKGLDLLLEALAQPAVRTLTWRLVVAGEFYDDPQPYYDQVARLGLEKKVHFDVGFVPRDRLPWYFSAADLVTQPYRSATQSGITQMAYHFDCPMLVTRVGGLPEMVPDREAGYVVDPEPPAIADAIDHFISRQKGPAFSQNVGQLKQHYSWDAFVTRMKQFIKEEVPASKSGSITN